MRQVQMSKLARRHAAAPEADGSRVCAALVGVCLVLSSATVSANTVSEAARTAEKGEHSDAGDATPSEKAALAKQLWDWYGQASALHDAGKLSEAWDLYQKIWKHRKTYDVATSLGGICLEREQYAEAAHYYKIALQEMVPTQSPAFVAQVKEAYEQAKARSAEVILDIDDPAAWKNVKVRDERSKRALEEPVFLEEGRYTLVVTAEGAIPVKLSGSAAPGVVIQWPVHFEQARSPAGSGSHPLEGADAFEGRSRTVRHPWIVLPIGGALTLGLGVAAWSNAKTGKELYDDVRGLNLAPGECAGEPVSNRCSEVQRGRGRSEDADARAMWFGAGAAVAAVATGLVYWLWETEVPVQTSYDPLRRAGEMRLSYEF